MDRILTTHVGSLVRPDELVAFLRAREAAEPYDEAAFEECLRRSVADVVRRQAETGIDIVSDGEFGKTQSWSRYIRDRLGGFEAKAIQGGVMVREVVPAGADKRMFPEFYAEYDRTQGFVTPMSDWVCTGPITYTGQGALARDIRDLQEAMEGLDVHAAFLPVVAPASAAPSRQDEHYASDEEFLFAIADALHEEYAAVADAGLLVQVDDAHLANMHDRMVPPASLQEYRAWAELRIEALNHALRGIPAERVRYHVCWGSWNAPHVGDVGLRDIVDLILRVNAGGLSLEQANPRHEHEWRVWEDVELPEGKVLLPGLVGHVTNVVEHPELIAQRIVRLARLVGRERVIASTDCGFAQGPFVRRVHPTIMWAKLRALVEGAQLATRQLWP
jgi:5-methyltetrahydropteroyltriglutamate--homocysteine methyltransferase